MSKISRIKIIKSIVFGSIIGMISSALVLSVMAAIMSFGVFPSTILFPMSYAAVMIGGFAAGFGSAKINGDKGLICGLCSAILFYAFAVLSGCITGLSTLSTELFIRFAVIMLAGAIGGIIGVN